MLKTRIIKVLLVAVAASTGFFRVQQLKITMFDLCGYSSIPVLF